MAKSADLASFNLWLAVALDWKHTHSGAMPKKNNVFHTFKQKHEKPGLTFPSSSSLSERYLLWISACASVFLLSCAAILSHSVFILSTLICSFPHSSLCDAASA